MFTIKEFFFLLPELVLLFSAVLLMILYPITQTSFQFMLNKKTSLQLSYINEYRFTLILIYFATLILLYQTPVNDTIILFEQQYILTPATQFIKGALLICIILLLLIAPYQSKFLYWEEHIILTIFVLISGMLMVSANDFLILWLSSEFQTFSFILGIGFFRHGERALSGAMIYFVTAGLMSSFFLLGVWLIYGATGSINFSVLALLMESPIILKEFPVIFIAALLIFSYFAFKLALAPLHLWSLNIFTTANLFIVYQIAIISKLSAILPTIQIISLFLFKSGNWFWICIIISMVSILLGALGAFKEDNIKRFLAYSSINHFGWIFLPLSLNDRNALQISFIYFCIYIVLNVSLFALLFTTVPHSAEDTFVSIENFSSIATLKSLTTYIYLIILFSFVGIPPLLGFFGKFFIFVIFIVNNFIIIPILLIPLAALSAFYYLFLIIILFTELTGQTTPILRLSRSKLIILCLLAILHIFAFIYLPSFFTLTAHFFM